MKNQTTPSAMGDTTTKAMQRVVAYRQKVRRRAYEIYEQHGAGHEFEDWLQAEAEVRKEAELTEEEICLLLDAEIKGYEEATEADEAETVTA